MEVGPSPARDEELPRPLRADLLVARQAVQIPRDRDGQLEPVHVQQLALEELELPSRPLLALRRVHPQGLGQAQDHAIARPGSLPRDPREPVELRLIHVGAHLHVESPEPRPMRQLDREVAAPLPRSPRADRTALAEPTQETRQTVIPVVVAGQGAEQRTVFVGLDP